MARRRYGRRRGRHGGFKIPVISLAILGAQAAWVNSKGGTPLDKFARFALLYTGFDATMNFGFYPQYLLGGYGPWVVKRFVLPIARPRLPVKGLPISIS